MEVNYFRGAVTIFGVLATLILVIVLIAILPQVALLTTAFALLYTYVIYPVIIFNVSKTEYPNPDVTQPLVSVIVPAHNEQDCIVEKVANCVAQTYPNHLLEIVVVDDGSTDSTLTQLEAIVCPFLKVVHVRIRSGKCSAILQGLEVSVGDVIVLTDANVFAKEDAIEKLVAGLSKEPIVCVSANVLLTSPSVNSLAGETTYQGFESKLLKAQSRLWSATCVDGGMYAIRRDYLLKPRPDTILDDFAISMGVLSRGMCIGFDSSCIAHEASTFGIVDEFKRRVRLAEGAVQVVCRGIFPSPLSPLLFWQFVSHKLMRWLSPAFLILLAIALLTLSFQRYQFAVLGLGCMCILVAVAALGLLIPSLRRIQLCGIVSYLFLVQFAMLVGVAKAVTIKSAPYWNHGTRRPI